MGGMAVILGVTLISLRLNDGKLEGSLKTVVVEEDDCSSSITESKEYGWW
jgi:hypothetical protein